MSEPSPLAPQVVPVRSRRAWRLAAIPVFAAGFWLGLRPLVSRPAPPPAAVEPSAAPVCPPADRSATLSASVMRTARDTLGTGETRARFVPAIQDGRLVGRKVYAIRRGSPLEMIGLANGDVIRAVDGVPLDPLNRDFSARDFLGRDSFTLEITRRGCPIELRVDVL